MVIADVRVVNDGLEDGDETEARFRVAGRLAARRGQGKAAFLDLVDRSGRIQLHASARRARRGGFERLVDLDLGDLFGDRRRGLPLPPRRAVAADRRLGPARELLRPPPEKHHGLQDVETRFRHREPDLIANEEARALFVARGDRRRVRRFLDDAGLPRGRDAGPAAALRRRGRAALHDAP